MKYKLAIVIPALYIDHYASRLFLAINGLKFLGQDVAKVIVGPAVNESMCPPGYVYLKERLGTRGVFDAVTQGIRYAIDELGVTHFTYINCDDLLYFEFRYVVDYSMRNPQVIVTGRVQWLEEGGESAGLIPYWPFNIGLVVLIEALKPPITQQGVIVPVRIYERLGGLNLEYKYIADTDFWLRASRVGERFYFVNKVVAGYTIRLGQISSDRDSVLREQCKWSNAFDRKLFIRIYRKITVISMNVVNLITLLRRIKRNRHFTTHAAMRAGGFSKKIEK